MIQLSLKMLLDSQLKFNRFYWIEVVDKNHPCFEKQYKVLFTGIAFRNVEFLKDEKNENTNADVVLKKIKMRTKKAADEYFFLNQIKIFREAEHELFNTHN
ncbi:MAG: hypothetical protein AB1394_07910 [Bacteroidota bacterium]